MIGRQCDALARCGTRDELGAALAAIIRGYSPRDLGELDRSFRAKVRGFDPAYRDRLTENVAEYLLETCERALLLDQQGAFARMTAPSPECTPAYMAIVLREFGAPEVRNPRLLFLKYLFAAFPMLVLDGSAHPAGMPFPGGDRVGKGDSRCWCPAWEKSGDVDGALCPFCPACKTPEVGYLHELRAAPEHRRRALIDHYHDGHYNG